jgi:perosamine synthetase
MDKLPRMNAQRQEAAEYLTSRLAEIDGITPPPVLDGRTHVYQTYSAMLDSSVDRANLLAYLNEQGIGASVHFDPPVHMQPAYQTGAFAVHDLSVTEYVASHIVSLPMYPGIGKDNIDYVVEHVRAGIANQR